MPYRRNRIHNTTLYLSEEWWAANDTDEAPCPSWSSNVHGIERLRITLPSGESWPKGWKIVKTTKFGSIKTAKEIETLPAPNYVIRQISRNAPEFSEWVDFHRKLYIAKHLNNPAEGLTSNITQNVFAGDDLCEYGILAAFDGGRMVGVSSLRLGESALELGWTGFLDDQRFSANAQIIHAAIKIAATTGALELQIEVDDNDKSLMLAADYLKFEWNQCYVTYEKILTAIE